MDPGGPRKENALMEEKGSGRKLGTHSSNAHMAWSFHGTERSVWVEMMLRGSLLPPAAWETQLVQELGGPGPLSSGQEWAVRSLFVDSASVCNVNWWIFKNQPAFWQEDRTWDLKEWAPVSCWREDTSEICLLEGVSPFCLLGGY